MKKNINKIAAFAIGISVMSGSIVPVFASDTKQSTSTTKVETQISQTNTNAQQIETNQVNTNIQQTNKKNVLTLDEAINLAISNSDTLALDIKKINYQSNTNDTNEELDDYNNVNGDLEDFKDDTRELTLNQLKQQKDFDEDVIRQKVTEKYNNIVTSQIKIDKATKELKIKNKELEDTKFKESIGMITVTNLKSTELEIQKLQNTQKSSKNALKDAEYSFKVLTGKDVTQYKLEQDIKYETLKIDGSVDPYLDEVINKYLKYNEQLVKLNKDYYNDSDNKVLAGDVDDAKIIAEAAIEPKRSDYLTYEEYMNEYDKYDKDRDRYTNAISARLTYLSNKLNVDTNQISLNKNKKEFKQQLKTYYTNIITSEDNINYLKQNIEVNNKKLSDAKLKCDLGMITESAYNAQVVSSEDLDLQLRSEINNYNTLKEKIQKPWIAFSNS